MMSLIQTINFQRLGDARGSLVALETGKEIPFSVKRVYYIFGTQESIGRGFHAHKTLKQVAICVCGSCRFVLDDGKRKDIVVLDSPNQGLLVDSMVWHEMYDFSEDCVLLMLASEHYDEADYIRDYDEFICAGG